MVSDSAEGDRLAIGFRSGGRMDWPIPDPGRPTTGSFRLRIENHGRSPCRFRLDALQLRLSTEGGELPIDVGSNALKAGSMFSPPIGSAEMVTIQRPARLEWFGEGVRRRLCLIGTDDLGQVWRFDGLRAGNYRMSFTYENQTPGPEDQVRVWTGSASIDPLNIVIH